MQSNKWLVAVTVMLPTIMVIIDTSVVNVSLDHIRGSLSAGIDEATWSITSYLAANAVMIPMTGWMSRYFGRKRYLNFSVGLFTLSSLLCGAAWAQDTIKVGVVGPRTGAAAATGQAFDEGIKLATEYVNSKGGVLGFGKTLEPSGIVNETAFTALDTD